MSSKKILWLCGWYPSEILPYNGDFIKRHAEAVSIYEDITIIHVIRDPGGQITKSVHTVTNYLGKLNEIIIYYYVPRRKIKFLERVYSAKKYNSIYKAAIRKYIDENGRPGLVHVHMGMQVARVVLWLHRIMGIRFLVTEHWSGFLKEAKEKFFNLPFYLRRPWKNLLQKAKGISTVSKHLAEGLNSYFPEKTVQVIPNVVNEEVFNSVNVREAGSPVFLHVSGLDDLKNPLTILRAFRNFNHEYPDSILNIIGSTKKEFIQEVIEMGLHKSVFFYSEMPQARLAGYMHQADALILYSKYETFGCVIIEANACGTPVIVSDIPVFHETVADGENGVFAGVGNADLLAKKMKWVIEHKSHFDKAGISQKAISKYSYAVIGKQFSDWYNDILLNQS